MPPLPLTDEELDSIMRAAAPLQPRDRDAFLRDVANALQGLEIGPGLLHRIVCEVQRRYWDPSPQEPMEFRSSSLSSA